MDYLPPVACVELSADRFYICLIDVNGAADLPRQLGGWNVTTASYSRGFSRAGSSSRQQTTQCPK